MVKFILSILTLLALSSIQVSHALDAPEKPTIIPRISWGANEQFTSVESSYWQEIFTARANYVAPYVSPEVAQKRRDDSRKALNYINQNFSKENTITQKVSYDVEGGFKLAWPQRYTDQVNAIVVHHTATEYDDSLSGMKDILKFHTLTRQWGDIGYNYVIGYDGEIFEGRKGGKYVGAAHSKWNNYSTAGIAVMGDYSYDPINEAQYTSLEKLIKYLAWEYGIDFNNKYYYHSNCSGEKCDTFPLETYRDSTLVGHRDTGHTTCPGDKLYAQIAQIREDNLLYTKGFKTVKRGETVPTTRDDYEVKTPKMQRVVKLLSAYSDEELEKILILVDERLETEKSEPRKITLQMIKIGILSILRD